MFGYVRAQSPELKVREQEMYRGTYCGLCRAMGKCTGQCSRMTLSYDFVFLALVRMQLTGESFSFEQKRCLAHPLKKRNSMKRNATLNYCAHAAALLNYHKVSDDLADEKGFKKFRACLASPMVTRARKKALRAGYADLDQRIAEGLAALSHAEQSRLPSVDVPAEAFGEILAHIVSFGLEGKEARIARSLGMAVGKWIYIADALDDWGEDAEKDRYNSFRLLYGDTLPSPDALLGIRDALKNELMTASDAVDLVDFESLDMKNIILNILYLGMPAVIEGILQKRTPQEENSQRTERIEKTND
ncbi:MAG: hypothetical protein IJY47_06130 [Clostridia bacterium]|nr:hypothetical protein [Clostridia bacterium]